MKKGQLVRIRQDSMLFRELNEFQFQTGTVICAYNAGRIKPQAIARIDVQFERNVTVWGKAADEFETVGEADKQNA